MSIKSEKVCPVEKAGSLDNKFRKLIHNPYKILKPYIQDGMNALDVGCGPGFFTIGLAHMVGEKGKVVAADLQDGMLKIVKSKIIENDLENRVVLHKCEADKIGLNKQFDFILLFYLVHEIPDKVRFFHEISSLLKPDGQILVAEPPFHVSKDAFAKSLYDANKAGLVSYKGPKLLFSKTAILKNQ